MPLSNPLVTTIGLQVGYPSLICTRQLDLCWGSGTKIIRGPNGCGKSTFLRTLTGIIPSRSGRIIIGGHDLDRAPVEAKKLIGFAPDRIPLPPTAIGNELLRLTGWAHRWQGDLAATEIARAFAIDKFLDQCIAELSLGQRRRLLLVAALAIEPTVALLDEPTAGLDAAGIAVLGELITARGQRGRLTICTTHEPWFDHIPGVETILWPELAPESTGS